MMRNRTHVKEVFQVGLGKEHHPGGQDEGAADGGWGLDEDKQGDMCPGCGGWASSVYPILAVRFRWLVNGQGSGSASIHHLPKHNPSN